MILGFILPSAVCQAATFSWPTTPSWAATGPTNGNTETIDYGYNAQGSLRVSVFNSGVTMSAGYPATSTSANAQVDGGTNTNSLQLASSTTSSTASYQQITISFMYTTGVSGVSFTLWDVDATSALPVTNGFVDLIKNVSATTTTGTTIYATASGNNSTYNTIANNSTAALTVTGASSATNTGKNGDQGNVTLSFTGQITSLTFQWANIATGTRSAQYIGISPINFTASGTVFPEVNSSGAALIFCGGILGFGRFRRRGRQLAGAPHGPRRATLTAVPGARLPATS